MYGLIIVPQKSGESFIFFCACFLYKYRGGSNTKSIQNT